LIVAQLLHAATFGVYHGAAIQLIHRYFRGRHQGRGQALYSSLSFGAGGAVGALYSGYTWASGGGVFSFGAAALVSAAALLFAWRGLKVDA
jgi:PPP family 3-phenylpropionic acid transporter